MAVRRLTVLAATALVAACSAEGAAPAQPREHRIAIVGDSFTEGSDEGGVGWRSWPAVLRHNLLEAGTIIDLEVAAEGSAGYVDPGHAGNVFRDKANALSDRDDLVIFFGGLNDGHVDPSELRTAVHDTFAEATASAPRAKFIVIGPAWPTQNPPADVTSVRDVIHGQADEAGLEFVDPIAEKWLVDSPELIGADGVHPTDRGHEYLAEKIAILVRNALGGH